MEVYRLLQSVDRHQAGLFQYSDPLCDFLYPLTSLINPTNESCDDFVCVPLTLLFSYHIKYMHIGDQRKEEIERVVSSLHPPLQMRLRFLVPSLAERQAPSAATPTASEHMQLK